MRQANLLGSYTHREPSYEPSITCPSCRRLATFDVISQYVQNLRLNTEHLLLGQRVCPKTDCKAHIFFVLDEASGGITTYPAETIDFDSTNIPTGITEAFQEALLCHANQCYTAAAIMVRKTLEELCHEKEAEGDNLKARIQALSGELVIPQELLDGLDDLRLLGNDAAHIESREYDEIGKAEVEVGIKFTKEVLKAAYQYSALLEELRGLKTETGTEENSASS